jgi:cation transport ATPase
MDLFSAVTGEDLLSSKRNHNISWELESHLNKEKTRILGQIGWVYQLLSPYLFFLSLVILLWNIFTGLKKRRLNLMTVFSMATLGAIFSITFVMTLVTITSYSEVARIMQVSFPLVLLFILSVFLDVISQNEISPVRLSEEAAL